MYCIYSNTAKGRRYSRVRSRWIKDSMLTVKWQNNVGGGVRRKHGSRKGERDLYSITRGGEAAGHLLVAAMLARRRPTPVRGSRRIVEPGPLRLMYIACRKLEIKSFRSGSQATRNALV
ncbi:hypothetical protein NDU88_006827 [Pleurodeles waltl]|uniref:Uncharacterized protein n=1 Tax=Pleurodeles waltl TaxID=8319 RepID=A0AAV7SQN7_PLEWA|nr:hypothetical protein NDU88_006827 [Pleurodeles waltl]